MGERQTFINDLFIMISVPALDMSNNSSILFRTKRSLKFCCYVGSTDRENGGCFWFWFGLLTVFKYIYKVQHIILDKVLDLFPSLSLVSSQSTSLYQNEDRQSTFYQRNILKLKYLKLESGIMKLDKHHFLRSRHGRYPINQIIKDKSYMTLFKV